MNKLVNEIAEKNALVISDNSFLLAASIKELPIIEYSRFVGNLFNLIHSYKPDFVFFLVQDDLYDINEYCKYSRDKYCQALWVVFTKDDLTDMKYLNIKRVKIVINPNKITEQICSALNTAISFITDKYTVLNLTETTLNFALSQFNSIFPDLSYEVDTFNISNEIINGVSSLHDKLNDIINEFTNKIFKERRMMIECNGHGVESPNNTNECIIGPREFTRSAKYRKVDDVIIYICYALSGLTALLCLISGFIFYFIRNKKGFQYQDWKMSECIIIGLLLEVCPCIYVLNQLNDYSTDNSFIPMELLYLVYEMTIGGFYLPVYRVYKRVRLSQRYENLKRKARMLMDDEKDIQNSPSSHSLKGSSRDAVVPINNNNNQPDSENSSSNKESENPMVMGNIIGGLPVNNSNSTNTSTPNQIPSSTMSHMSIGGVPKPAGQMLGGMPRPIIDLIAVGDSDSNKLRRGEWFEYLCWVFIALILCILSMTIKPIESINTFESIEVTTNDIFDHESLSWNIQHYYYIWGVKVEFDSVFIYIIFGLCILHSVVMILMLLYMVRYGDNLNPYEYSIRIYILLFFHLFFFLSYILYFYLLYIYIVSSYYLLLSAWAGIIATLIRFSDSTVISAMVMTIYVCAYAILCLYVMFYPTIKYMSHKPQSGHNGNMKCQECGFDLKPPDINGNDLNTEVAQFEEEPEGGAGQQPRKSVIRSFFNKLSMRPDQFRRSVIPGGASSSRSVAPRSVIE